MREIRKSGSMSGSVETEHGGGHQGTGNRKGRQQTKPPPTPPRHLSTLPVFGTPKGSSRVDRLNPRAHPVRAIRDTFFGTPKVS